MLHAINNMMQECELTESDLNELADELKHAAPPGRRQLLLPWAHPHRGLLGGNFDVNVLDMALQRLGMVRMPAKAGIGRCLSNSSATHRSAGYRSFSGMTRGTPSLKTCILLCAAAASS